MFRDTLTQTMLIWSDHVSVLLMVTPSNLKVLICSIWLPLALSSRVLPLTFLLEWMSILFVFRVFNLKPFHWSHRFAKVDKDLKWRLKTRNVMADYKDGQIISKENCWGRGGRTEGRSWWIKCPLFYFDCIILKDTQVALGSVPWFLLSLKALHMHTLRLEIKTKTGWHH